MQGGFFCALSQIKYYSTVCEQSSHDSVCSSDAGLFGYCFRVKGKHILLLYSMLALHVYGI